MQNIDMNSESGKILLIDKPYGWTSFDVVKKIRNTIKLRKVGHAGTLDPLATGLLVICTGKMTKQVSSIQAQEKVYLGEMELGKKTLSYDLETEICKQEDITHLTEKEIYATTQKFIGKIMQIPPPFSAIKVKGKRAYSLARKGENVHLLPRQVSIRRFQILSINFPFVQFCITCSKGTYIRSLINDFGEKLGVGAYLLNLKRLSIGKYTLKEASSINDFIENAININGQ